MPEYLAPGVYIEEIDACSRSIEGVGTSTAGFAGETERGPTRLTLVTGWHQYTQRYGGFIDRQPFNCERHFLPYAVRGFFENGGQRLVVARVSGEASTTGAISLKGVSGPTSVRATGPGAWGNNLLLAVKPATTAPQEENTGASNRFRIQIAYFAGDIPDPFVDPTDPNERANPSRREPDVFEDFDNLSADPTLPNFIQAVVNAASELVEITDCGGPPALMTFANGQLAGGSDTPATRNDYVGAPIVKPALYGLAGLAAIPGISLMAIPDAVLIDGLVSDLLDTCEAMKDRFAIVCEPHPRREVMLIRPPRDTSYGATYYPWIRLAAGDTLNGTKLVPPTGHLCGIYARVDSSRGVHQAPANEVIRGIVITAFQDGSGPLSHAVNHAEQEVLNARGVNVIRDFRSQGRGVLVWGARTMSSDPEWRYVNVRRLCIFIEQSIHHGTRWAVTERNSEPTWIAIRESVTAFLNTVWRNGALMGDVPQDAFFVKCDRTTMTQDDIDNGRLICQVGVAPLRPAEFIILRIGQIVAPGSSTESFSSSRGSSDA
jgi:phage tail sheath protein FI